MVYGALLNNIADNNNNTLEPTVHTTRVQIAAISTDLQTIHSGKEDHVIDLKPIELTARELKQLFYPTGNEFKICEEYSISESLRNKLKFDNMFTSVCHLSEPLNITKTVVEGIETDLNIRSENWKDSSRVNVHKKLAGITSIFDLGTRYRRVDCSMTFNEYLDILRRSGISIVNHDTNIISPENEKFNPDGNKLHNLQAREFHREPVWWGGGELKLSDGQEVTPLTNEKTSRELYQKDFTYQQITTGVVFKICNLEAHDTVFRVNFNVNWASYQGIDTNAGETVSYKSGETVFKPFLPMVISAVLTKPQDIKVVFNSSSNEFLGWLLPTSDSSTDSFPITVDNTYGFFNDQKVQLYKSDGSLITSDLTIKKICSQTELILSGEYYDPVGTENPTEDLIEEDLIEGMVLGWGVPAIPRVACCGRTNPVIYDDVKLGSPASNLVFADSKPPIADEDGRDGWLFKKTASDTAKFNYYLYSQGSHAFTLGQIDMIFMTGSVDVWDNISSCPFIIVYTKPTGVGDHEVWYHSKVLYTLDATKKINLGETVNFYAITNPNLNNGFRDIKLETKTTSGDGLDAEEILYITVHSDSSSLINTKILLSNIGYSLNCEVSRNISLIT